MLNQEGNNEQASMKKKPMNERVKKTKEVDIQNNFDINEFMKRTPNEDVSDNDYKYGLNFSYEGQYRQARKILIDLGYSFEAVAGMSDTDVMTSLLKDNGFATVCPSYKNEVDMEVVFLVPKEILERCYCLCR